MAQFPQAYFFATLVDLESELEDVLASELLEDDELDASAFAGSGFESDFLTAPFFASALRESVL